jgi:molybdopterin-guanine dinucleotide biosynthesis protein A
MGRPKASLDWHGETMLERVVGAVAAAVDGPVVVVRAPGQELPILSMSPDVVEDAFEDRGPLEGIAAGLRSIQGRADAAYVSSTDVPLLHPAFVRRLSAALDATSDAVVPRIAGQVYPLSAVYRAHLLQLAESLLDDGLRRASLLPERARTRYLDDRELLADPALAAADPELRSLHDVNDAAAYRRALENG